MTSTFTKSEDGTITITIDIPWQEVKGEYDKTVTAILPTVEVKGFRKGKAPKDLAMKQLDKNKVYEEALKDLLPKAYTQAITTHKIAPFMSPEIQLTKAKEGEAWQVVAKTCEKPKIDLGDYQTTIKNAKGELKKNDIWVPGKDTKKDEKSADEKRQKELNVILETLYKSAKVTIPTLLIQTEVNRRLSRLIDELAKLGMNLDQYLATKGKSADDLRKEHTAEVVKMYTLEFILEGIADSEKIVVEDSEIDKMVSAAGTEAEKKSLAANRYYIASIIRRQKTLDKLLVL